MSIKDELSQQMKTALKSGDKDTLAFARNLHAAIRKKEIDERVDLDDAAVLKIIATSIKQRQDSVSQFRKGGREDLASKEEAELKFLQAFQPPQLSDDELSEIVKATIGEVGASSPKEMGKVMKALLPKVQGKADGRRVSECVKANLS